jgi:hypothetical protein
VTDISHQFSRDELLLHEDLADLIDSFANAIEHGGSGDMIDRWRARKAACEALEAKVAAAIKVADGA